MDYADEENLIRKFRAATEASFEAASMVLEMCEWDGQVATNIFTLFSPKPRGWLNTEWINMLRELPFGLRKKVVEDFVAYFPHGAYEALSRGLDGESCDYLAIISIRAFANSNRGDDIAQTLEMGERELLPLFQQWARELKKMLAAPAESLEYGAARERFKELLNHTLPSMEEANPLFRDIVEDASNMKIYCDNVRQTALHIIAKVGDLDLLKDFLEHGAAFEAKDDDGNTALHAAACHSSIVRALLSVAGSAHILEQFVEETNNKWQTALHLCGDAESAGLLLRVVPRLLFRKDNFDSTALHLNTKNPSVVQFLLSAIESIPRREDFVQQVDYSQTTALHRCENAESARLLLQASPTLLFKLDNNGNSALHRRVDDAGMLKVLLDVAREAGQLEQFVQQTNAGGKTALHLCNNAASARLLLQVSPSLLFAVDNYGHALLHRKVDNVGMLAVLLDAARKTEKLERFMEEVDGRGQTALHICNNLESARLLLTAYSRVASIQCKEGYTPLHVQAIRGQSDICRLLLEEYNVDVNAANSVGQTALHFACHFRRFEIVDMLLKYSANLLARDNEQRNVLHHAFARKENGDIVDRFRNESFGYGDWNQVPFILNLLFARCEANAVSELVAARDVYEKTMFHYWAEFTLQESDMPDELILSGVNLADKLMLAAGINAAAQDGQGDTMMHILSRRGLNYLLLHLIKYWGLSIHVKNNAGKTALDVYGDLQRRFDNDHWEEWKQMAKQERMFELENMAEFGHSFELEHMAELERMAESEARAEFEHNAELERRNELKCRAELQRTSRLAGIVTLRLPAKPRTAQSPWERLPEKLLKKLRSFLV